MSKNENETDEELVIIVRSKDKEVYKKIVQRYQDKIFRYVAYLIGNKQEAVDIVQETFIKAFINLNGFDIKKKFSAWIYRIAHNEAVNFFKKTKKEVSLKNEMNLFSSSDTEKIIDNELIRKSVDRCLKEIPVIYSEPLILYFLEEKSYEEISDILRIPMGTVATRINRAKVIMKKICEKQNKIKII